jgi:hypothetical protein
VVGDSIVLRSDVEEELVRLARQHVEEHHPDMERSDEQLRSRVAADAYDA